MTDLTKQLDPVAQLTERIKRSACWYWIFTKAGDPVDVFNDGEAPDAISSDAEVVQQSVVKTGKDELHDDGMRQRDCDGSRGGLTSQTARPT